MKYKVCDECLATYSPDTVDSCPACSMAIIDKQKKYPKSEKKIHYPESIIEWNEEEKIFITKIML